MTKERLSFLFAATIAIILLSINLPVPFNVDNDLYQSMGWALFKFGRLPYVGSWDHNFPGIVFTHAASIALFGNSEVGFRILDTLCRMAIALLLFSISRRWLTERAAIIAVCLYSLAYLSGYYWLAGQRDEFAVLAILIAVKLTLFKMDEEALSVTRLLCIGALVAVATLFRPTYLLPSLALLFLIRDFARSVSLTATGFIATWLAVLLPYALIDGGLREFYLATIAFNREVYEGIRYSWSFLESTASSHRTLLFFSVLGLIFSFINREQTESMLPRIRLAIFTWSLSSGITIWLMGKYFIYHYEPMVIVLVPLAAYGIDRSLALLKMPSVELGLSLILIGVLLSRQYPFDLLNAVMKGELRAKQSALNADPLYGRAQQEAVSDYLKVTGVKSMELAGIDPGLRWRTKTEPATRFTKLLPIMMTNKRHEYTDYQRRWQQEFVEGIRANRPQYVVISNGPQSSLAFARMDPYEFLSKLPKFDSVLGNLYAFDRTIGGFQLYRRK